MNLEFFAVALFAENVNDLKKRQIAGRTERRGKCLGYVKPVRAEDAVVLYWMQF